MRQNDDARARVVGRCGAFRDRAAWGFAVASQSALRAFVVIAALVMIGITGTASSLAAPTQFGTKTVLFISSERSDMPAMRELEGTVRDIFHDSADPEIELFPEYLDFARFPIEQYAAANIKYLRERYAHQPVDLILVTTGFALDFVLSHRQELFPKAPVVFCAAADREITVPELPPDVTGVVGHFDIERTLNLIFTLQPNVTEIVCVGGTAGFDRFWEEETRKVLERFVNRTRFRWITDKSLKQTANELSKLPPSAAVFYISMLADADGHSMTATDAARDLCRASKAPVYGLTAHFLDAGTVGGAVFDFGENGRKAANLVLKVLRGEWVPVGSPQLEVRNPLAVNWVALQKWNLNESLVPAEAEVRHESPGLWETHRTLIIWTVFVVLIQSALIFGWLAQRLWRRRAERALHEFEEQARRSREQIDRLARISLLGEMTASIAHELNQPLSAIVSNANAARRFLHKGQLNSETMHEILEDVSADARRAHDVIQHIRNTIKKGAAVRERINLNDVVNHVAHSIRPDARIYSCEIETELDPSAPEIEGDPVQIQQVLINLVSNAFDAMAETPAKQRKVEITTEGNGNGTVCLTVRDHGVGIRPDARERLFEQFFTTKDEGLGMGLAIVRSIIESHGGRITAENVDGGGASFHLSLPIAPKKT